jgi:hypothetical protein
MDVMTTGVITVHSDTSVQAVAKLLSERGISGVPVVDAADRLVGIVSEGDLLHRVETGTERPSERLTGCRRSWWLDTIASHEVCPADDTYELAVAEDRHALDPFCLEQHCDISEFGRVGDRDNVTRHDLLCRAAMRLDIVAGKLLVRCDCVQPP